MSKKKYFIVIGLCTAATGLLVLGLWLWSGKTNSNTRTSGTRSNQNANKAGESGENSNATGIPLVAAPSGSKTANGLKVSPGSGANVLGQLRPDSSNPAEDTAAKMLDPATFGQYEKYRGDSSALFAELQPGTGAELTANKKAAVLYKGWLTNGQLFDMSRANDKGEMQPFIFTLGARQVIAGWEQALAGMKEGGVRFVIVPPAVGYGAAGQGSIPGNAVLIFQVQLLDVE